MEKNFVGIINSNKIQSNIFTSKYVPILLEEMKNQQTWFLLGDWEIKAIKYLSQRGFRNCIIYHTFTQCKHNIGNYKKIGEFSSEAEIKATIMNEAIRIINMV